MSGSNNKTILTIIAVAVVAIAGILFYQAQQQTPAEEAAESIGDAANDVGDAISGN